MDSIYIPHLLKAPNRQRSIILEDFVPGLETLTPLRGTLVIRHGGNFLDVSVQAETIVTLACDRCLQQFNHRLTLDTSEIIWLEEPTPEKDYPLERELAWEDLSESLAPNDHFPGDVWLYEQLSLALPLRQVCGADCQAPQLEESPPPNSKDSRWSSLESLKKQL